MNFKKLWILAAALLPLSLAAQAAPKVVIKSEIASPVVLENIQDRNYLKVSLVGFPMELQRRSPINLALVIDRSSSMNGDKIEKARGFSNRIPEDTSVKKDGDGLWGDLDI